MTDVQAKGVTVVDMQEYMNVDDDVDKDVIQNLIAMSEEGIKNAIDADIDIGVYRQYSTFNQAVRVQVDFTYFSRGELGEQKLAYPPSYLYMVNSIRWKIRRDQREASSQSPQSQD